MDIERFRTSPLGSLLPIDGEHDGRRYEHFAFIPKPLPELVDLSPATYTLVSEADQALGELRANLRHIPNPRLLIRPALTKEAVATSALEGTYAPIADVLEADYVAERLTSPEVREIRNYVSAAQRAIDLIEEKPICLSLMSQLQGILVKGTRGETFDAGRLRERQVCIGQRGRSVEESRFVPPPPGDALIDGMDAWEKWVNLQRGMPVIVRAAMAHYQFETLHPFADGNGRLGRLLIALQLMQEGILEHPILNISPWFEPRRPEYQDHLLAVSATGDFDPWVAFFAEAIRARAEAASRTVLALLDVRQRFEDRLKKAGASGAITRLVPDLIGYPLIDVKDAQYMMGVSNQAANSVVARLVELGILRQANQGHYRRLFVCDEVYSIVYTDDV